MDLASGGCDGKSGSVSRRPKGITSLDARTGRISDGKYDNQGIERLQATAHAPAEGWNPYIGYGAVDPVAVLTNEVPRELPPKQASPSAHSSSRGPPRRCPRTTPRATWT
ncbi:hypothetical protein [Nocardia fluminea]|uniref:hypothetical protein n=1 Tax=Nocardia fluminea TaxID=134984 RepID=UPI0034481ECF